MSNDKFADLTDDELLQAISKDAPYKFDDEPPVLHDPDKGWWPSLYPTQMEAFQCEKPYLCLHGPRYSGKSICALHMLVRHCYSHSDALAMIVSITKTSARTGGAWSKLFSEVLPEWREGIDLAYTDSKMDAERNHYCRIQNVYGGWSMVMLKSIPAESMITERWKGAEPTFIFPDEITETPPDATDYFDKVVQQLFRKKPVNGIPYRYQYVGACNPADEGEDHWVHKKFIAGPDPKNKKARQDWEKNFANFFMPIEQNVDAENLEIYIENLRATCSTPDEVQRAMEGKWVKKLKGQSIFRHYFRDQLHVYDGRKTGKRLTPHPSKPIIIGYDPGDVNQGVSFMQEITVHDRRKDRIKTLTQVFDELVLIDEKLESWEVFTRLVMEKMQFWCGLQNTYFDFQHISDKSALNRYRIGQGGMDQRMVERASAKLLKKDPDKYPHLLKPIKMVAAPKMDGSVAERVKILINKLTAEEIIVDVHCHHHLNMFRGIVAKKDSAIEPQAGSPYKHALDALTYPMYYLSAKGGINPKKTGKTFGVRC